ncbi:hypothetical protein ES703_118494 [subsurface metagenome]
MEPNENRSITFKIAILWLAILLMGSFWLTLKTSSDTASLTVLPKVPREGEPVIATVKLNNPSSQATTIRAKIAMKTPIVTGPAQSAVIATDIDSPE